jgi:hypothetical protein
MVSLLSAKVGIPPIIQPFLLVHGKKAQKTAAPKVPGFQAPLCQDEFGYRPIRKKVTDLTPPTQ